LYFANHTGNNFTKLAIKHSNKAYQNMYIEQHLAGFLSENKSVTLQGIGTFHLLHSADSEMKNPIEFPADSLEFSPDAKANKDDLFIAYLMEKTKKIKPLVTSDLESYTLVCNQFLNIGKQLSLKNIGVLHKKQKGEFEFKQGNIILDTIENPKALTTEKKPPNEISFASVSKKKSLFASNKTGIAIILLLFIGIVIYLIVNQYKQNENKQNTLKIILSDTAQNNINQASKSDSSINAIKVDSTTFTVILKSFSDSSKANKLFSKWEAKHYKGLIQIKDSNSTSIGIEFKNELKDTTRIKDSLRTVFGKKLSIRIKK